MRMLAYQCAVLHEIKVSSSWGGNKEAGVEWLDLFLKTNYGFSICRQPCSGFNQTNVEMFFDKLSDALSRYHCEASSVRNMEQTGVSTVFTSRKMLWKKILLRFHCETSSVGNLDETGVSTVLKSRKILT